jgi:hypothetical protein
MNTELLMDNSTLYTAKNEDKQCTRSIYFQKPGMVLPTSNEEISPGRIFLLSKLYIDIKFIYPISYPSTITMSIWQFPPSLLLSFSFFLFQFISSFNSPFKLIRSLLGD